MRRALTCACFAAIFAVPAGSHASRGEPPFQTTRTFMLPAGRVVRTFTLHERSGVVLLNRISVQTGMRIVVTSVIPRVAGVRVTSWASRNAPAASCRHQHGRKVCTQGEEWCPMPRATWHIRLVKLRGPAGAVRFDLVVAPPPTS